MLAVLLKLLLDALDLRLEARGLRSESVLQEEAAELDRLTLVDETNPLGDAFFCLPYPDELREE